MMKYILIFLFLVTCTFFDVHAQCFTCADAPKGTIFCDDFESALTMNQKYFEYDSNAGDFMVMAGLGRDSSKGVRVRWQKGEVSAGGFKKSFGRTPGTYISKNSVFPESDFDEIYWRMDVKSQINWQGAGPAKLSRALCLANENWATATMAHLWSGGDGNNYLGMDPASGIGLDGKLKTSKYNDFDNLRWLGFKSGTTAIYKTENSGKWYCIEGHVKLNTPGLSDGIFEFWINDTLQATSNNLNWHSTWNQNSDNFKINAVFFENYWNAGSPIDQERYFDNIVISTNRIGCQCNTSNIESNENYSDKNNLTGNETSISPNPSSDYLNLKTSLDIKKIEIFTILGFKVIETEEKQMIDIRSIPIGTYFLQIHSDNFTKTMKFVIIR